MTIRSPFPVLLPSIAQGRVFMWLSIKRHANSTLSGQWEYASVVKGTIQRMARVKKHLGAHWKPSHVLKIENFCWFIVAYTISMLHITILHLTLDLCGQLVYVCLSVSLQVSSDAKGHQFCLSFHVSVCMSACLSGFRYFVTTFMHLELPPVLYVCLSAMPWLQRDFAPFTHHLK